MKQDWQIYALTDPRNNNVRYVGVTFRGGERYSQHLRRAKTGKTHCNRWIKMLLDIGLKPGYDVLATGVGGDWKIAERQWIAFYRQRSTLTNLTDGGEGSPGCIATPATRAKISDANRRRMNRPLSPEYRAKQSLANRGRKRSAETRAKMSAGQKLRGPRPPRSAEHNEKLAAAHRGKPLTAEHRAKISAALTGKHLTPETRMKLSASLTGRLLSPEHRAKLFGPRRKRKTPVQSPA